MDLTVPSPPSGDVTTDAFLARVPESRLLQLAVSDITEVAPGLLQVTLGGADLSGFGYAPGQDLMFLVDTSDGRIIRRRYTIRRFDPVTSHVSVVVATDSGGPGSRWAGSLRVGDPVEAIGPRGKITLAEQADWHLFFGDDVAVPAIAAMVEALPAGSAAYVHIDLAPGTETEVEPTDGVTLEWTWLPRQGHSAGDATALRDAANTIDFPDGPGHVYVFGEARVVGQVKAALRERGLPAERISAKAYWGRGRANASHGEPLKDKAA